MRLTIPFAMGILLGKALGIPASLSSFFIIVFTVAFLLHHKHFTYQKRIGSGIIVWLLMLCLGSWLPEITDPRLVRMHYQHTHTSPPLFILKVLDVPKHNTTRTRFTAQVLYRSDSTYLFEATTGTIVVHLDTDSAAKHIQPDDELVVFGKLQTPQPPDIPESFDYSNYLAQKGIYDILHVKKNHWKPYRSKPSITFRGYMYNLRENWVKILDDYSLSNASQGIIEALVWGKTDDIDKEQMQAYTRTGVVHILAVSGMHVGLIYALTRPITQRIRGRRSAILRFMIPATILWLYAAITGFSPSVSRAAVMLTLIIVTEQFQQTSERMNMYFTSMFLLLLVDPKVIFHIGFQLSYAAVLGIMLFQAPLKNIIRSPFKVLQPIAELCTVSVAAQLMTLPLCLYHFHQFPTYFLIANIVAVPLSTAVLYIGLIFFSMHWWSPVAYLSINLSDTLIRIMNIFIGYIDCLPYALLERIPCTLFDCALLYTLLYILLKAPNMRLGKLVIRLQLLLLLFSSGSMMVRGNNSEIYTSSFQHKRFTYHVLHDEEQLYFMLPDSLLAHIAIIEQDWVGFIINKNVNEVNYLHLPSATNTISVDNERLVDYFHAQENDTEYAHALIFPQTSSRHYYHLDSIREHCAERVYFDGKWTWKKKNWLLENVRNPKNV